MAKQKESQIEVAQIPMRPALTEEGRENQLIALAYNLAEQRLRNGTATSQEVVHFLKEGSNKAKYELEKMKLETELIKAKSEAIQSAKDIKELYEKALSAMKVYKGEQEDEEDYY